MILNAAWTSYHGKMESLLASWSFPACLIIFCLKKRAQLAARWDSTARLLSSVASFATIFITLEKMLLHASVSRNVSNTDFAEYCCRVWCSWTCTEKHNWVFLLYLELSARQLPDTSEITVFMNTCCWGRRTEKHLLRFWGHSHLRACF